MTPRQEIEFVIKEVCTERHAKTEEHLAFLATRLDAVDRRIASMNRMLWGTLAALALNLMGIISVLIRF